LANKWCNRQFNTISGIAYALSIFVSVDQLIAKLQKLSTQVEKGMSKQGFTVWTRMIREDLYRISNTEVRKGGLKLLSVVECAGFCLDRAPEARETLILPNLKPLIDFLKDKASAKTPNAPTLQILPPIPMPAILSTAPIPMPVLPSVQPKQEDVTEAGFNPS
jgi:hypothetical protein